MIDCCWIDICSMLKPISSHTLEQTSQKTVKWYGRLWILNFTGNEINKYELDTNILYSFYCLKKMVLDSDILTLGTIL